MTTCTTWIRACLLALAVTLPAVAAEGEAVAGVDAKNPAIEAAATPAVAVSAAPAATPGVDDLVALYNPDILALDGKKPRTPMTNLFTSPASDIAREVAYNTWFNIFVFLPFLILPLVLLFFVIFRFRDRKDGRKAATFVGNHTLEIVWTAIPCLALVVVSVPVWHVLWRMELPPANAKDALNVEVRGKKFAWDYKYQDYQVGIGQDFNGRQEPLVLCKGRTTVLNITSNDVNHAWWVPAFGVKKDAIIGRYTNTWFTPDSEGVFKGQCAELCGNDHGMMIISAVVVAPELFHTYIALQRQREDSNGVWKVLKPDAEAVDQGALDQAVGAYLAKGNDATRLLALRYWIASHFVASARVRHATLDGTRLATLASERRALLDQSLAGAKFVPAAGSHAATH